MQSPVGHLRQKTRFRGITAPPDSEGLRSALPPGHGYRRRRERLAGRALDRLLDARQLAAGIGRELDAAAAELPRRRVLVLGVYGNPGARAMSAAVDRLRGSRHRIGFALGAMAAEPAQGLEGVTELSGLEGGKFANLNRLAERSSPLAHDWLLLVDDDMALPRRFLDRIVCASEALRFELAQPALSRSSHAVWDVNRRRPAMARQTRVVETGPVVLMSRVAWKELTPFPERGMGWGACLHWAAVAERLGWRMGVVDATPVRHETRPPATAYRREEAVASAVEFLASHEHLRHEDADRALATHPGLP